MKSSKAVISGIVQNSCLSEGRELEKKASPLSPPRHPHRVAGPCCDRHLGERPAPVARTIRCSNLIAMAPLPTCA